MAGAGIAERANILIRRNEGVRRAAQRLTKPVRAAPMPVVLGNGRGLRVCTGPSTLLRLVSSVEGEVETALLELLHPGATVFDIGANIGWFSLLAARRVGPAGKVIAFEPSVPNAAIAERNAAANRLQNLTVIPAAVGDRDGWASFSPDSSLKGKVDAEGEAIVPILSLDSWLSQAEESPPDVLKIDVEGAEGSVLRGMSEILRTAKPALIIELHGTNNEIADLLDAVGYTHHPIDHDAPTRDAPWWVHVLARP